jgi:CelD/BcsL family acetyltransferase involved in cellulose biosynthesis
MVPMFITTEEELVALRPDWERFVKSSPETDMPFYSWDWFYRSWVHFEKPRGFGLSVLGVREGEKTVGILPLLNVKRTMRFGSHRKLRFNSGGMMPRNTMYTDSQYDQETVFRAAWEQLFNNRSTWDILELANVPNTSPFHHFVLDGEHTKGYSLIQNQGFNAPYIELTGTLDDYLNSLGKGARKDIRKHVKHFDESNVSHSVRFYEKPDEMEEGLQHLNTVHSNSWKGAYTDPNYPQFYQEITPVLAEREEVKIAIVFLDNVPIGGAYMLCKNGAYYGCIRDYDQKYKEHAPGILLLDYQLEHLLKEGGKIFDFCGTTYDHKEKFGTGHHNHSTFQIFHSGLKSRLIFSAKTFWLPLLHKIQRKPNDMDIICAKRG